jgi:hypothetical protein
MFNKGEGEYQISKESDNGLLHIIKTGSESNIGTKHELYANFGKEEVAIPMGETILYGWNYIIDDNSLLLKEYGAVICG